MNHLMIKIGALINPNANSTKIVTQMQHEHMQVRENMQACTPSAQSPSRVYPTIQMTSPMRDKIMDRKANGRPRRNPRGLHSHSSSKHMITIMDEFCSSNSYLPSSWWRLSTNFLQINQTWMKECKDTVSWKTMDEGGRGWTTCQKKKKPNGCCWTPNWLWKL